MQGALTPRTLTPPTQPGLDTGWVHHLAEIAALLGMSALRREGTESRSDISTKFILQKERGPVRTAWEEDPCHVVYEQTRGEILCGSFAWRGFAASRCTGSCSQVRRQMSGKSQKSVTENSLKRGGVTKGSRLKGLTRRSVIFKGTSPDGNRFLNFQKVSPPSVKIFQGLILDGA